MSPGGPSRWSQYNTNFGHLYGNRTAIRSVRCGPQCSGYREASAVYDHRRTGSITHFITLYIAVGTGQEEASASHRLDRPPGDLVVPLSPLSSWQKR